MNEHRPFAKDDKVNYKEKPGEIFIVKAVYVTPQIHQDISSKKIITAYAEIDGKYFEIDAPEYYFTYVEV